mmetsp:Transcript_1318/g.826  ORF Transcript_1318/g.826 Transcript_1318/m.826 type:complete len:168 (+) Transcript_1318:709-1212(+)
MVYTAKNIEKQGNCEDIDICRDCVGPAPAEDEDGMENCYAVKDFLKYYVSEFYPVKGAEQMKSEIYKNGPISCGISSTGSFHKYTGGIYSEPDFESQSLNHEISVVGWGIEDGVEYWIGRNSWGTYWGEQGFFRMQMYKDNLLIETDCAAGIPSWKNVSSEETLINE